MQKNQCVLESSRETFQTPPRHLSTTFGSQDNTGGGIRSPTQAVSGAGIAQVVPG